MLLRDDLLLHSLVQVIRTKTEDEWAFHNGFEADVILCNPDSSLSGVALRRAGRSVCVSVVHDGQEPLPGTKALRAPIKSVELIALLNAAPYLVGRDRGSPLDSVETHDGKDIVDSLLELMRAKSPDLHAIESDAGTLFVTPASRSLSAAAPLAEADILPWLGVGRVRIRRIDRQSVPHAESHSLDKLLWMVGLTRTEGQLLPGVPEGTKLKLKRWPDFGKLAHETFHFRMAALLARGGHTVEQLAAASSRPVVEARAFVNACAMCDLLRVDMPVAAGVPAPLAEAPRDRRHYSSILKTIRSALGLRA
ncbi:hypothetical protein [Rhodanobacter sp. DHG33]|uniref:hypothetical protein n=1 Tax=Rhodanobacter sp. DHG33 TaxID=2775921 RepID=UPI00177D3748|nr:hypothetical protein [Rhodanobacter sp. DHG33]MBD8898544.1 hypothetical protein [Rhodanobacter sp. DHG33]